jgi:3'5'-cyclic nucleotide phosphodiesterase
MLNNCDFTMLMPWPLIFAFEGVPNSQRNKEEPNLADKYKGRSVAEQNSIDMAWSILMGPSFRNLQEAIFASKHDVRRFRQLLVNLIMATDIFEPNQKAARNARWERLFHSDLRDKVDDSEYRTLKASIVIEHIIQAADVSHTMQHWQVYVKWNERLFQEMYRAYESGRGDKDPSEGWYKGEIWFFDNYGKQLISAPSGTGFLAYMKLTFGFPLHPYVLLHSDSSRKEIGRMWSVWCHQ